jgi:hypothetical protein
LLRRSLATKHFFICLVDEIRYAGNSNEFIENLPHAALLHDPPPRVLMLLAYIHLEM